MVRAHAEVPEVQDGEVGGRHQPSEVAVRHQPDVLEDACRRTGLPVAVVPGEVEKRKCVEGRLRLVAELCAGSRASGRSSVCAAGCHGPSLAACGWAFSLRGHGRKALWLGREPWRAYMAGLPQATTAALVGKHPSAVSVTASGRVGRDTILRGFAWRVAVAGGTG